MVPPLILQHLNLLTEMGIPLAVSRASLERNGGSLQETLDLIFSGNAIVDGTQAAESQGSQAWNVLLDSLGVEQAARTQLTMQQTGDLQVPCVLFWRYVHYLRHTHSTRTHTHNTHPRRSSTSAPPRCSSVSGS